MYDGRPSGFYTVVCLEVSLYVYLYEDVEVYDGVV